MSFGGAWDEHQHCLRVLQAEDPGKPGYCFQTQIPHRGRDNATKKDVPETARSKPWETAALTQPVLQEQISISRPSATQLNAQWPVTGQPHSAGTGQAMGVCRKAQPWSRVRHWRATPQPQA